MAAYDFEIFHRAGKLNPADAPSRRPNYEGASPLNTKLLPTLQNKLTLWTSGELSQYSKEVVAGMIPIFQIVGVQVVIPRKEVQAIPETAYEDSQRPIKTLIRDLQDHDNWVKSFRNKAAPSGRRRTRSQKWELDSKGLLKHKGRLYIPRDEALR